MQVITCVFIFPPRTEPSVGVQSLGLFQIHSWKFQTALIKRKKDSDIYIKQATMQAFKLFYLGQMFRVSFYKRIRISFWIFVPLPLTEPVELGLKQNQPG